MPKTYYESAHTGPTIDRAVGALAALMTPDHAGKSLCVAPDGGLAAGEPQLRPGAAAHNSLVRGDPLGASLTDAQAAAIADGSFAGLCLGDYWTDSQGTNWRIHAFDYFYRAGHPEARVGHNLVIVPDTALYTAAVNAAATTDGGWVAMDLYKTGLANALTRAQAVFGSHILTHPTYLTNAVTGGVPTSANWKTEKVNPMTEEMIFGCSILRPVAAGANAAGNVRVEAFQLPLLRFAPEFARTGESYWLRDVSGAQRFCRVYLTGTASDSLVTEKNGVRPFFVVG